MILTGSRKNVLASRRTLSGQVAETIDILEQAKAMALRGSRTHDGLPILLSRTMRYDPSDIILKALIQHSIRFIQYEVLHTEATSAELDLGVILTYLERSRLPASARSSVLPGVPTTILTSCFLREPN